MTSCRRRSRYVDTHPRLGFGCDEGIVRKRQNCLTSIRSSVRMRRQMVTTDTGTPFWELITRGLVCSAFFQDHKSSTHHTTLLPPTQVTYFVITNKASGLVDILTCGRSFWLAGYPLTAPGWQGATRCRHSAICRNAARLAFSARICTSARVLTGPIHVSCQQVVSETL